MQAKDRLQALTETNLSVDNLTAYDHFLWFTVIHEDGIPITAVEAVVEKGATIETICECISYKESNQSETDSFLSQFQTLTAKVEALVSVFPALATAKVTPLVQLYHINPFETPVSMIPLLR